jgi:hypothetical protein
MNLSLEIKHNQGKQSFVKELAKKAWQIKQSML